MRFLGGLVLVSLGLLGCTKPNPAATCADGACIDPDFPFCDVDGVISGESNVCVSLSCTPGDFLECRGDNEVVCNAGGTDYEVDACQTGCSAASNGCNACVANTSVCGDHMVEHCGADGMQAAPEMCQLDCVDAPTPHCGYLEPRYLPDVCDVPASGDLTISTSGMFDTTLNTNCNGGIIAQTGGPAICVVRYSTISITATSTLIVVGGNALALIADQSLSIDGVLDIGAKGVRDGPGGGFISSNDVGIGNGSAALGAGGAGFHTAGGAGGSGTADGGGHAGGAKSMDPAALTVLLGGTREQTADLQAGGGGGGAATLVACRGSVSVTGKSFRVAVGARVGR
jgi:hypothetical protein